jgi:hypothetical protein
MSITIVLGFVGMFFGFYLGLKRAWKRITTPPPEKPSKRRSRRVNVSEDAPEELTEAELAAMGKWFSE